MLQIGTIKSIGHAENYTVTPDDRQSLVKVIKSNGNSGVVVEDYGLVEAGEIISLSAVFSNADYEALLLIWKNRTLSTVILDDGKTISNARIVIKSVNYWNTIDSRFKKVTMEIWRI